MIKLFNLFCIYIIVFLLCSCQTFYGKVAYPVDGTYQRKGAQGMTIHNDIAFLFNDGGHFRVFDLKKNTILKEGDLASSSQTCHVNNVCFVDRRYNDKTLLYVTEYLGDRRCLVESLTDDYETKLLQSIIYTKDGKNVFVWNWTVDIEKGFLYALHNVFMDKKNKKVTNRIVKFRLPNLSEGKEVVLTENDVLDSFDVYFANGVQGGKIKNGYWYISTGLREASKDKFDAERAIIVIDLKKKEIARVINLTSITTNEPEDIDFYKGKILLYCGQAGGLYFVKDK